MTLPATAFVAGRVDRALLRRIDCRLERLSLSGLRSRRHVRRAGRGSVRKARSRPEGGGPKNYRLDPCAHPAASRLVSPSKRLFVVVTGCLCCMHAIRTSRTTTSRPPLLPLASQQRPETQCPETGLQNANVTATVTGSAMIAPVRSAEMAVASARPDIDETVTSGRKDRPAVAVAVGLR